MINDLVSASTKISFMEFLRNQKKFASLALIVLIFLDIVFLVGDIISVNPLLELEYDRSYPEYLQYQKFLCIFLLQIICYARTRKIFFVLASVIPLYLLADDWAYLHEHQGLGIAKLFLPASEASKAMLDATSFRPVDFGEMIYAFAVGSIILLSLFVFSRKSSDRRIRKIASHTIILLIIYGIFAVFIDAAHQLFEDGPVYQLMGKIEDFGEMVSISLWCSAAYKQAEIAMQE